MATQRDNRLNVRLSDDMMSRVQAIADDMGLPAATIGAIAIGEYVTAKERTRNLASQSVNGTLAALIPILQNQLSEQLNDAEASAAKALFAHLDRAHGGGEPTTTEHGKEEQQKLL